MSEVPHSRSVPVGASVRRRLGYDVEAGPSTSQERPRESSRVIVTTPKRCSTVLRNIRRLNTNISDDRINEVLLDLEEREERRRHRDDSDDSFSDISVGEDSGEEYVPSRGARGGGERPRPDFSGFLGEGGKG